MRKASDVSQYDTRLLVFHCAAYSYITSYSMIEYVEPDESLLNLYASYDLTGYFLLVDHYSKKVSYQVSGGIRWEKKCGLSSHY